MGQRVLPYGDVVMESSFYNTFMVQETVMKTKFTSDQIRQVNVAMKKFEAWVKQLKSDSQ